MKNIDLFDALDLIDPDFVDEARVSKIKKDKKLKEDVSQFPRPKPNSFCGRVCRNISIAIGTAVMRFRSPASV